MTWNYDIADDGSEMKVIDSKGNLVETIQNDGSGFEIPNDVTSVMREQAEKARANNNMERWRDIHIRLADNDIAPKE